MPRPSPQTDRVVAVTRLLAAHPDQGFTISEIARRLRLNKATCYPMLAALTDEAWLVRDPRTKTYRLGPALISLGEAASLTFPVLDAARPVMVGLSERLGVSCAAFSPWESHATLADQVWDVRSTVPPLRIGQWLPIRAPFGAVFVAWSDHDTIERWLGGAAADEPGARPERTWARAALAAIRRRGYVVELLTAPDEQLRRTAARPGDDGRGAAITPPGAESFREELSRERDFLPVELEPTGSYRVSTIEAPVFTAERAVGLGLALLGFTNPLRGATVHELGTELRDAAARLGAGPPSPPPADEGDTT